MSKLNKLNALAASIVVGALGTSAVQAASSPFAVSDLAGGYQLAEADGKMMEGKCGADKMKDAACSEDMMKDGKCTEAMMKDKMMKEGKCGEGKCGADKMKDGKMMEGKCGDMKKG